MRHAFRYLPAFLALLIPLGVLAFLGGRELSRQQDRAETFLRERAFDFLSTALHQFEDELARSVDALLEEPLDTEHPSLFAAACAHRANHDDVVELAVFDDRRMLSYPRQRASARSSFTPPQATSRLRIADALAVLGDHDGAIEFVSGLLDDADTDLYTDWPARLHLAGLYRNQGKPRRAQAVLEAVADRNAPPLNEGRPRRFNREWDKIAAHQRYGTLTRLMLAELQLEIDGQKDDLRALLVGLRDGTETNLSDDLAAQVVERAALALQTTGATEDAELISATQARLTELFQTRRRARDYNSYLFPLLMSRRQESFGERFYQVFDTSLATYLLVARQVRPEEEVLYSGSAVGFQIDLTSFTNRVLASLLAPHEDGYYLNVRTPDGKSVLYHPAPEGAEDWGADLMVRSTVGGLQFQAIPRNARQQLEGRRSYQRNRALLVLTLCLVAGAGAFFLVRSAGREAELASMKVDLVSRVSHELKTPLAMIKMYSETLGLGRTKDSEQATKFAHIISRESDRLTLLIDRILEFSRRQSGELAYHKVIVDLSALVEHVVDEYRPHVAASGIDLQTEIATDLHARVDPETLESAVINLIENAAKYTPASAAERSVRLELRRDGARAILDVLDRGIGIPPAERVKVFESFYRASNSEEARGAGLGLNLVQQFALAHDGTIEALPRPGGGTIFRLSLPLLDDHEPS